MIYLLHVLCCTVTNECLSNPCVNGAACIDLDDRFECNCTAGYTGVTCQTGTFTLHLSTPTTRLALNTGLGFFRPSKHTTAPCLLSILAKTLHVYLECYPSQCSFSATLNCFICGTAGMQVKAPGIDLST